MKTVGPSGSQFYQSNLMNSHYVRQLFWMHDISTMVGPLRILLHIIIVANPLQLSMCCLVQWGVPSIRQNEICNITASFLSEVCYNVSIEPSLQQLSGEQIDYNIANTSPYATLTLQEMWYGWPV